MTRTKSRSLSPSVQDRKSWPACLRPGDRETRSTSGATVLSWADVMAREARSETRVSGLRTWVLRSRWSRRLRSAHPRSPMVMPSDSRTSCTRTSDGRRTWARPTADRSTSAETPRGKRLASQNLSSAEVVVVGNTAVLYAEVTDMVLSEDDNAETFRMPMTQVWVRLGGRWKCLAGHAGPRRS